MRALGEWQGTQFVTLTIAGANARQSHSFTVDAAGHNVLSFYFTKKTTATQTILAMADILCQFTIENEQVLSGEFANIVSIGEPASKDGLAGVCAWKVMFARPANVSRDYPLKVTLENTHASTTFDVDVSVFGLAVG